MMLRTLQWVAASLSLLITAAVLMYFLMAMAMIFMFGEGSFMPWGLIVAVVLAASATGSVFLVRAAVKG